LFQFFSENLLLFLVVNLAGLSNYRALFLYAETSILRSRSPAKLQSD
jgi:hypothetical protein